MCPLLIITKLIPSKGPCTYDVRTEGGRGGSRIAQFCGQIRLIGCVKCGQGEGGSKIPKISWTSYVHGPLANKM